MYPTPSIGYTQPIGHLANGMELSNITLVRKARVKLEWLPHLCPISGHHVELILIKGVLTIQSIAVLYYKQVTTILSIAVCILGVILHSTPHFFSEHVLVFRLLSGYCLVAVNCGFCGCHNFWYYEGIKPPLYGWQGSLCLGGSIPCQGSRHLLIPFPTWRGTYLLHTPCLVLLNVTQFCEWLHQSGGPLSDGICGHQCHSLIQMHVFPLTSTAMSHYLWSSPIFCGCSS